MSNEEILIKSIEKAIKNGWDLCGFLLPNNCDNWQEGIHQWHGVVDLKVYAYGKERVLQFDTIVFNHDFAKAFWNSISCYHEGIEYRHPARMCIIPGSQSAWEYNLSQLAIAPDRYQYLKKFL